MEYTLIINKIAEKDLIEILTYISEHDLIGKARDFLKKLLGTIESLTSLPHRGFYTRELREKDIFVFQEIYCKSYRIVYGIFGGIVMIIGVLHGCRDLKKILFERFNDLMTELH